jgi:hypothetical protein
MLHFSIITKAEWKWVLSLSVLAIFITSLPLVVGWLLSSPDLQFIGLLNFHEDAHTYITWMKQAQEGYFLFEEKYTTEQHPRNIFLLYFLITGLLSRITQIPLIVIHQLMRVICGFTLLLASYLFISYFLKEIKVRRLAFILVISSAGLGGYFAFLYHFFGYKLPVGWIPVDQYALEAMTFRTISYLTHLCLAIAFMLLIYLLLLESFSKKKKALCIVAGIMALMLNFFHPYDLVTITLSLIFYFIYLIFIKKDSAYKYNLGNLAIFFLIFSPGILINYLVVQNNPIIKSWLKTGNPSSEHPMGYILGFGFVLLFAIIGIWRLIKEKNNDRYPFLICWLLAVSILIYGPFPFQIHLSAGAHILLCIFAAVGFFWLCKKLQLVKKESNLTKKGIILVSIFVLLTIPTNLMDIIVDFRTACQRSFPYFISPDFKKVLMWLDKNILPNDIVLASRDISNFIPAYTGSKVYIGHWAETMDHRRKEADFKNFMDLSVGAEFRFKLLKENKISYFIFSNFDKVLGGFNPERVDFLYLVYKTPTIKVYRVNIKE